MSVSLRLPAVRVTVEWHGVTPRRRPPRTRAKPAATAVDAFSPGQREALDWLRASIGR